MTRGLNRWWIVVLIAGITGLVWCERQAGIRDARRDLASAQAEQALIRQRIEHAREAIQSNRDELSEQRDWQSAATNRVAQLENQISRTAPALRWADPPADWPRWDTNSPYVWLRKEMFSELRIRRFNDRGEISPDLAGILGLSPAETATLNSSLAQIEAANHSAQLARVQSSESVAANGDRTMTLAVPSSPQDGAELAQQFQTALEDQLGPQRAGLIDQDTNWFASEFNLNPASTNTYTITAHTNGTYSVNTATGPNGKSSYGGTPSSADALSHVPDYLAPAFTNIVQSF